nr:claw keratin-like [Pogona vitticeps]
MSCCPPSCAIPSSTPSVGFGPCGIASSGCYSGYGGYGGYGGVPASPCGIASSGCYGGYGGYGGVPASALGITSGAAVGCITQIPSSEVTVQPPSVTMVIPGAILAASCEPLAVGGYSPCASGSGYRGSYGSGLQGICQSKPFCASPC